MQMIAMTWLFVAQVGAAADAVIQVMVDGKVIADELAPVTWMRMVWPTEGVSTPAALVNVIVQPPPNAVTVKKLAVVQSTVKLRVAVATAVPRAEIADAGPGKAIQLLPFELGIKPAGADSSAGVLTVLVAPFRTTELATVFERIISNSFQRSASEQSAVSSQQSGIPDR
ncbi:MAG: hypothetical protein ACXWPK_00275 [Isosphaeraceae bacterium]